MRAQGHEAVLFALEVLVVQSVRADLAVWCVFITWVVEVILLRAAVVFSSLKGRVVLLNNLRVGVTRSHHSQDL